MSTVTDEVIPSYFGSVINKSGPVGHLFHLTVVMSDVFLFRGAQIPSCADLWTFSEDKWEKTPGQTQKMLEKIYVPSALGTRRFPQENPGVVF